MEGRNFEKAPERFPDKEEVMEVIGRLAEGAQITRELSDEKGLYLLEVELPGEKPGEIIEYAYARKGESPGHENVSETAIHITYYQDGVPTDGHKVMAFLGGQWRPAVENPEPYR